MTTNVTDRTFIDAWNALDGRERRRLRRLVRIGRPIDDPELAALAGEYAQYQNSRPWARLFWLWFVPGIIVALSVAITIHPLVVGIVLALGAQGVFAHMNLGKAARAPIARAPR